MTDRSTDILANCIHELRERRSITQAALAEAVGVTRQTIIAIERGNYKPSVTLALKIARFFNMSVEEVFSLTDNG